MDQIAFELSVLRKCVAFKNISWASKHVGMSQPQISRIIKKIEERVGFPLIDRSSKRSSVWLPEALKLAEIYSQQVQSFERDLQALRTTGVPKSLRIGLLEGMMTSLMGPIESLTRKFDLHYLEVQVLDLSELEEKFFRSDLDLIFSSQEPGKRKFEHSLVLGYQHLEIYNKKSKDKVMSPFEFASHSVKTKYPRRPTGLKKDQPLKNENELGRIIVSNSLEWRRSWVEKYSAMGFIPTTILHKKSENSIPVKAIGAEHPWMGLIFSELKNISKI